MEASKNADALAMYLLFLGPIVIWQIYFWLIDRASANVTWIQNRDVHSQELDSGRNMLLLELHHVLPRSLESVRSLDYQSDVAHKR